MAVTTFKNDKEFGQDLNTIATTSFNYDINDKASRTSSRSLPKEMLDETTSQVDWEMFVVCGGGETAKLLDFRGSFMP